MSNWPVLSIEMFNILSYFIPSPGEHFLVPDFPNFNNSINCVKLESKFIWDEDSRHGYLITLGRSEGSKENHI